MQTIEKHISHIINHIDMHIEANRIRLGVCPSGIKPSKKIIYFGEGFDIKNIGDVIFEAYLWVDRNIARDYRD